MSLPIEEEQKAIVQKVSVQPVEPNDPPGAWRCFGSYLREFFGFRSLELAERYGRAKVELEESKGKATLLEAQSIYELRMAEAEKLRLESRAKVVKDVADAKMVDAQRAVIEQLSGTLSKGDARTMFEQALAKIQIAGGVVELSFKNMTEDPDSEPKA